MLYSVHVQDLKMEELVVQLDSYSRLGIPKLQHQPGHLDDDWQDEVEQGQGQVEPEQGQV